jgi:hypothetical protein
MTTVNNTSVDELTLKFCTTIFWGKTFNFCQNQRPKPVCYDRMAEYKAKFPACDPGARHARPFIADGRLSCEMK